MEFFHLITFCLTLMVALISPGPALISTIHNALTQGRTSAIFGAVGLATGAAAWCLFALLGLIILFKIAPWMYIGMKFLGALYLVYLAIRMWKGSQKPINEAVQNSVQTSPDSRAYLRGTMINLSNPKAAFFFGSIMLTIFPQNLIVVEKAIIVMIVFTMEVSWYTLVAILMTTPRALSSYKNIKAYIDRTCSIILGTLGLSLLFSK